MQSPIEVYSEIGRLRRVLLHRPGAELENLAPDYLEQMLFDDIPDLQLAQQEHDAFADTLRQNGVEVVYLIDLLAESLTEPEVRSRFIDDFLADARITTDRERLVLREYLQGMDTRRMISAMMAGVRKDDLPQGQSLSDFLRHLEGEYPFALDPIPNLYFTRDPFAAIGPGVSIHRMFSATRHRETMFAHYIFHYHPLYRNVPVFYDRDESFSLEGGDILVLNGQTLAVGISQRTHENAIERFARRILTDESGFREILAFNIPKQRTFMHLDTVFTMVDRDTFTVHPNILREIDVFVLTREGESIHIAQESGTLESILQKHLHLDRVRLLRCGSRSPIDAAREQWNDGSNTLAIAPGEVVVYSRNRVTNALLRDNGIKVLEIPSSELSRGRGGPRCMSMPLVREAVNDH